MKSPLHPDHRGRFGWLDRDQTDLSLSKYNEENHRVALEGAREA